MSDSVKLRFEHGIWCLVFSYLSLIAGVVFCFLGPLVAKECAVLALLSFGAFAVLVTSAISYFKDAIKITKKEKRNDNC